jgi:siroheme synthase (precorrin-2 oxidase/ferrochelatase)
MDSLPVFLRLRGRPVILIGEGAAAAAKRRLLERAAARIVGEEAEAQLALVATDAPEAVVARLRARGILVNTADRPDLCDFTLPAIVERDPVLIAIGTGGASAGLAKALRQRIEALLPGSAGRLAQALARAREPIRKRWPDAAARRRASMPRWARADRSIRSPIMAKGRFRHGWAAGRRKAPRQGWSRSCCAPAIRTTSRCARRGCSGNATGSIIAPTCPPRSLTAPAPMPSASQRSGRAAASRG